MLVLKDLHAFYGKSHVLKGVSLQVDEGEVVGLLGRNGAGKSTTLKSIMSLVRRRDGVVAYRGKNLMALEPFEIARLGLAYVPENRGIFAKLTVEENLKIATRPGASWSLVDVYRLFPRLSERRKLSGSMLSGGEQQMLAIARALVGGPKTMLLDEPSQGLAPVILQELVRVLEKVTASGIAVLLVEQNLSLCLRVARRVYVLDSGSTVYEGTREKFLADEGITRTYLTLEGIRSGQPSGANGASTAG